MRRHCIEFFSDQINGIYYVSGNDKNDENNEVNKKVKDKIKQLKTKMNHAKKQLRVFHHSLSQPTLQLNDEISELNSYLAEMVVKMHELLIIRQSTKKFIIKVFPKY